MKNKIVLFLLSISLLLTIQACTIADSSEVAVVVDQIGLEKGLPKTRIESGWIFYFPPTQDVFTYPTSVQHKVWTADKQEDSPIDEHIDVTSADGATFGLDVAFNFQLKREEAANVFKKYRVGIKEWVETRGKTIVRKELLDNAVKFASDSLLQHRNNYETEVEKTLRIALEKEGFLLNNIAVLKMDIPPSYREAINTKIKVLQETATVKSQTLKAEAEAQQKVATAKGDYEAAQYQAKTKEILSQPKMLELYKAETERIWANQGVSPYGNNNVFGTVPGMLLNRK